MPQGPPTLQLIKLQAKSFPTLLCIDRLALVCLYLPATCYVYILATCLHSCTAAFRLFQYLSLAQLKLKEEKETKRATLDSRHQYLFGAMATKLGLEESAVEEFLLEGDQVSR